MTQLLSRRHLPLGLLALGVVLSLFAAGPVRAQVIERVLVKVNGEIFTKGDLEARQIQVLKQQARDTGQQFSDEELKKRLEAITPQLLAMAVDEMLILQRGKELGSMYKMTDEQFRTAVDRIKAENKIETEEQFQAALKGEGITMAELRALMSRNFTIDRVETNEVFSRISVTEDEARRYYEAHRTEFTAVPTVTVREMFVKVSGPAQDAEARKKAEATRARLAAGESFEKLAGEVSDAPSKSNGGLVGPINRSELAPAIAKELETMKVGDLSPVVRLSSGYEFVKLEAATEEKVLPFEEARAQIGNKVFAEKQRVEFEAYLRKLRSAAIIEWMVPELKKLYDEAVAAGPAVPGAIRQ